MDRARHRYRDGRGREIETETAREIDWIGRHTIIKKQSDLSEKSNRRKKRQRDRLRHANRREDGKGGGWKESKENEERKRRRRNQTERMRRSSSYFPCSAVLSALFSVSLVSSCCILASSKPSVAMCSCRPGGHRACCRCLACIHDGRDRAFGLSP